jgi:hypothetical protein
MAADRNRTTVTFESGSNEQLRGNKKQAVTCKDTVIKDNALHG